MSGSAVLLGLLRLYLSRVEVELAPLEQVAVCAPDLPRPRRDAGCFYINSHSLIFSLN